LEVADVVGDVIDHNRLFRSSSRSAEAPPEGYSELWSEASGKRPQNQHSGICVVYETEADAVVARHHRVQVIGDALHECLRIGSIGCQLFDVLQQVIMSRHVSIYREAEEGNQKSLAQSVRRRWFRTSRGERLKSPLPGSRLLDMETAFRLAGARPPPRTWVLSGLHGTSAVRAADARKLLVMERVIRYLICADVTPDLL